MAWMRNPERQTWRSSRAHSRLRRTRQYIDGCSEYPCAKGGDLRLFKVLFWTNEIVGVSPRPGDIRELDEASCSHIECRHGGRHQAGALARKYRLEHQAQIVEGGTSRWTDIVDPLRLKPEVPVLAVGVMHVRPAHQIGRIFWRRKARGQCRRGHRDLFDHKETFAVEARITPKTAPDRDIRTVMRKIRQPRLGSQLHVDFRMRVLKILQAG